MDKVNVVKQETHTIRFRVVYSAGHMSKETEVTVGRRMSVKQAYKHMNNGEFLANVREYEDDKAYIKIMATETNYLEFTITEVN